MGIGDGTCFWPCGKKWQSNSGGDGSPCPNFCVMCNGKKRVVTHKGRPHMFAKIGFKIEFGKPK